MIKQSRALMSLLVLLGALFALPTASAQAQNSVITGKVLSDVGAPIEDANVIIIELAVNVRTNAAGMYSFTIPAARAQGQTVPLRVRAIGYTQGVQGIKITPGTHTYNFELKKDINRLSEVVVTGSIEGTERAKVPFAVGRVTAAELPVPSLNPINSLSGKVGGLRIATAGGQPGSSPEILMRGPTSINASGRSQSPLIIVDGAIQRVGSLDEIGGLDIESIEVVKGAAGASMYGATASNGVIIVKTKRGSANEGVKWTFRSELGYSDIANIDYMQPINHQLQLDETGKRFCVAGGSNVASCSRTLDWMTEIMRINNVAADTTRTSQTVQFNALSNSDGSLQNVFQANIWPGRYYRPLSQITRANPLQINSIEANGRAGSIRYYVSGQVTNDPGGIKGLNGQQQRRGRVNLDYAPRSDMTMAISVLFDKGITDLRSGGSSNGGIWGQIQRGAPSGTNYLARDTLGRLLVVGGGAPLKGSGNGAGTLLYDTENYFSSRISNRLLGSLSTTYTPSDWATFEATFAYDNRSRTEDSRVFKGYRTIRNVSTSTNFGNQTVTNRWEEAMNGQVSATFRRTFSSDLSGKIQFRGLWDQDQVNESAASGQQYVVKDVFTLSNTTTNKTATGSYQTIKNLSGLMGANVDYKGRYIVDGTFRYDGSSLFGAGNRWAPFGRGSLVWRASEEPWYKLPYVTDLRFRVSRGSAGNTPRFDAQYETYSCSTTGCSLGQAGNKNLKPETTVETEVGGDFTLFNRFGFEVTNSNSTTKNQILNVPTPTSLGFTSQWRNAGTLANHTWELAVNIPIVNKRDLQWSARGTYDRTRTYITELFMPEYFTDGGTSQGTGSFFLISARRDKQDGFPVNRYGNIWGRKFYRSCGDLPSSVQPDCGEGKAYQVDNKGYVVWVGAGNSYKDGITKNLWETKLSQANSPWNFPLWFGHPIIDRPLRGEKGEGVGKLHILGNTLPDFRTGWSSNLTYKKFTLYALAEFTVGHEINNQGKGWGMFDLNCGCFDGQGQSVEEAKPTGYTWRVGGSEGVGTGGLYDQLGPNNFNVESGSYGKLREMNISYHQGPIMGQGDWTFGIVGRNLMTWTKYTGVDPETGASGGSNQSGSALINQVDAFGFPPLRQFSFSISTRF